MPFRTLDPADADRLTTVQARRAAMLEKVRAGERARLAASRTRQELEDRLPARERAQIERCMNRLDAEHSSERLAEIQLFTFLLGPIFTIVAGIGMAVEWDSPLWACVAVGASGTVLDILMVTVGSWWSARLSHSRLARFRAGMRALPFAVRGAEDTLGHDGVLSEVTAVIRPVGELPVETVANLVALVAPEVRVDDRDARTTVERRLDGVAIVRRFGTSTFDDGRPYELDTANPIRWINTLQRTLSDMHDLHPIASVELSGS